MKIEKASEKAFCDNCKCDASDKKEKTTVYIVYCEHGVTATWLCLDCLNKMSKTIADFLNGLKK